MEDINKKSLLHIFLGVIMIQSFFLLAYSANFLLAETTSTPTVEFVELPASPLSEDQYIYVQATEEISSVTFRVIPDDGSAYTTYQGNPVSGALYKYSFLWPTNSFPDGSYNLKVLADPAPHIYTGPFQVQNETATTVEFVELPASPLSGNQIIFAQTNKNLNSTELKFRIISSDETIQAEYEEIPDPNLDNKYYFTWPTTSFADGSYKIRALIYDGTIYTEAACTEFFQVQNETATTDLTVEFIDLPSYSSPLSGDKTIYAQTTGDVSSVTFRVVSSDGTVQAEEGGTPVSGYTDKYQFIWSTNSFTDGSYKLKVLAYDSTNTVYVYTNYFQVQNETTTNPPADETGTNPTVEFVELPASPLSKDQIIFAQTNETVSSVTFKVIPGIGGVEYTSYAGALDPNFDNKYSFTWPTCSFTDRSYDLVVIAYNGTDHVFDHAYNLQVQNETTTTDPLTIEFVNLPASPISGNKTIYAQTSETVSLITFKVIPGIGGTAYTPFTGTLVSGYTGKYSFLWPTTSFNDGSYKIRAIAYNNTNTNIIDANTDTNYFQVQNETTTTDPLTIKFIDFPPSPLSGDQIIHTEVNQNVTSVIFKVLANGTAVGIYAGNTTSTDPYHYHFAWPTANSNDGSYMIKAIASNGTETVYDFRYIEISNDSTISDPQTPLAIKFIDSLQSPIKGDQKISISANSEIFGCIFKIEGPRSTELQGIKDSSTQCHILLRTINFPNGYYTIRAIAKNNTSIAEIKLSTKIENIEESIVTEETYPTEETTSTTYNDYVYPETFIFELPIECKEKNISTPEECQKYMSIPFKCREENILNPEECKKFMIENFMPLECKEAGITTKEECDYLLRNAFTNFENFSAIEIKPFYTDQTERTISRECEEKGITSLQECKEHMILINMPEECQLAQITDPAECERIMFEKHGPQECLQAQIFNAQECEKFMFKEYTPDDCQKAGILNPEACKKFILEKYSEKEDIPTEKFPIECRERNIETIEQCTILMQNIYMPKECKIAGLENGKECETYLQQRYISKECLQIGIKNRQECDGIMFKKYAPQECLKANIENGVKCEEFIFNKYAPEVKCSNVESWQCKNSIKERFLGNILTRQIVYNRINEKKEEIIGKSIETKDLEEKIIQEKNSVPIRKKDLKLKVLSAKEGLVLNEEDRLIQTSPIVITIDSDGDGLPDDIEKRFGTDPYKVDTDGDGYDDLAEIKNGYNPLGDGKLERKIAPIEKAIIENRTLEHPKTAGEINNDLAIENISNIKDDKKNMALGYILSGTSKPNELATIYIYSDLPIVVTVQTDKYGNWEYELKESLIDGEHEAYVVINDDTGKVLSKSNPINFFIKEAKAVSAKNFVTPAIGSFETSKESESSLLNYIIIALIIMLSAIIIFTTLVVKKKKAKNL